MPRGDNLNNPTLSKKISIHSLNMAIEQAKNEQANSVEERLRSLYELQTTLSEIDRIRTIRGELPEEGFKT